MSDTIGWIERMNDSLQQVHSWKWNQTTGSRGLVSRAWTTCGDAGRLDAGRGRDPTAELEEVPPGIALHLGLFPDGQRRPTHVDLLQRSHGLPAVTGVRKVGSHADRWKSRASVLPVGGSRFSEGIRRAAARISDCEATGN